MFESFKKEEDYETSYSFEATVLCYHNYVIKNIRRNDKGVMIYVFDNSEELRDTTKEYHKGQLQCNPKKLFFELRQVNELRHYYENLQNS